MTRSILSEEERACYGTLPQEISPRDLQTYFTLNETCLFLSRSKVGPGSQLACAIQFCATLYLGTTISSVEQTPPSIAGFVASQMGISYTTEVLTSVPRRTLFRQRDEVVQYLGLSAFDAGNPMKLAFFRWLRWQLWCTRPTLQHIFYESVSWLRSRGVLLPAATTLERLILHINEQIKKTTINRLYARVSPDLRVRLEDLLLPVSGGETLFETLRPQPTRVSIKGLISALLRIQAIRKIGTSDPRAFAGLHRGRIEEFIRYVRKVPIYRIKRLSQPQRVAYLYAWHQDILASAQDDVLDVLYQVLTLFAHRAQSRVRRERSRSLASLDRASLTLARVTSEILNCEESNLSLTTLFRNHPPEQLRQAVSRIIEIADDKQLSYLNALTKAYPVVRRFLPLLINVIRFSGNPRGLAIIQGLKWLSNSSWDNETSLFPSPLEIIPKRWMSKVARESGDIDRRSYTFCVMLRMIGALKRRDIYVDSSHRWRDPRSVLIPPEKWEKVRKDHCEMLQLEQTFDPFFASLSKRLAETYQYVGSRLDANESFKALRTSGEGGRAHISLKKLDEIPESDSLRALRSRLSAMLPEVDLSEVMLEVDQKTNLSSHFYNISGNTSRAENLAPSISAVLLAEACNIGIGPVAQEAHIALSRKRLEYVQAMYICDDAIEKASSAIVDAHAQLVTTKIWGDGSVASADGLRFRVPVQSVSSGLSRKYFGSGRGITYYNYVSDQYTGLYGTVIPGTLRDSLYILDGLLEQRTCLRPKELMSDTAGFCDVIFAICSLLGFKFSPRLASLKAFRIYTPSKEFDTGKVEILKPLPINSKLISEHWDDILRAVVSLKEGLVCPSALMRTLQTGRDASLLAKALAELGKLYRTLHILEYIDDESYRRSILNQLNLGERRHSLMRAINYGGGGQIRKHYFEEQQEQLNTLSLVTNILVYWNTLYIQKAIEELRAQDRIENEGDLKRISPLVHDHINMFGRYNFDLRMNLQGDEMRPLRSLDPAA